MGLTRCSFFELCQLINLANAIATEIPGLENSPVVHGTPSSAGKELESQLLTKDDP